MKRIHCYPFIFGIAIVAALLIMPPAATAQQQLSDSDLRQRGKQYYDRLPAAVGLEHAPDFADAVRYLFAYEQRRYRDGNSPGRDLMEAMNWLYESLEGFKMGKADAIGRHRSDDQLRKKGLSGVEEVKNSVDGGKIWNIEAYISAYANLYAYLQLVSSSSVRSSSKKTVQYISARNNFKWLRGKLDQLVKAGGKGDNVNDPATWLPANPKPGSVQVFYTPDILYQLQAVIPEEKQTDQQKAKEEREARQKLKERLENHASQQEKLEYSMLKTKYKKLKAELKKVASRLNALEAQGMGDNSLKTGKNNRYHIILKEVKEGSRIPVIKAVRELTGLGLKESKELVDRARTIPTAFVRSVSKEKANQIEAKLEKAGAQVIIKQSRIR